MARNLAGCLGWTLATAACSLLPAYVRGADGLASAGLVAAYGFEESAGNAALDASGHGNTALLVGATRTTQGKLGSALTFDGVSSRVTLISDAPSLRLTTAMTLEAWVKPATVTSDWRDVIYKGYDNY